MKNINFASRPYMYFSEQGNAGDDATFITIFLVSSILQSSCLMQSAVCGLRSAVCKCHTPPFDAFSLKWRWFSKNRLAIRVQHVRPFYSYELYVPFDTLNLFPFLTKIMLINTSWHKNNMIYIIKQEGLSQNKANSSLVCTRNCEMDFFWLFQTV